MLAILVDDLMNSDNINEAMSICKRHNLFNNKDMYDQMKKETVKKI